MKKPPKLSTDDFLRGLKPDKWKDIEADVIGKLRALREVHDSIYTGKCPHNTPEQIEDTKRTIVRILAVLAMFVNAVKETPNVITLDPPPFPVPPNFRTSTDCEQN